MNHLIFDDKEPTKKELIVGYLSAGIPLFFGFYMAVWGFGQIADRKAQNPDNLIKGCMYYYGYRRDKHNDYFYYFSIEKNNFLKREEFYNFIKKDSSQCHLVSYIKLDFILFKKIFVYDYHGKIDNKDTLSINKSE